jgi:hypothetical protein
METGSIWYWLLTFLFFGAVGYGVFAASGQRKSDPNLQGLKGWLLVVAVALIGVPIKLIIGFYLNILPYFTDSNLKATMHPESPTYDGGLYGYILHDITVNILLFAGSIVAIFLFFSKKKSFPKFYIILLCIYPLTYLESAFSAAFFIPSLSIAELFDPITGREFVFSIVQSVTLIVYLLRSRRAKLTFIN